MSGGFGQTPLRPNSIKYDALTSYIGRMGYRRNFLERVSQLEQSAGA